MCVSPNDLPSSCPRAWHWVNPLDSMSPKRWSSASVSKHEAGGGPFPPRGGGVWWVCRICLPNDFSPCLEVYRFWVIAFCVWIFKLLTPVVGLVVGLVGRLVPLLIPPKLTVWYPIISPTSALPESAKVEDPPPTSSLREDPSPHDPLRFPHTPSIMKSLTK